jgi:hypothetical protein
VGNHPVSDEVGAALGAFVAGGVGPRHAVLTRVFTRAGYGRAAPYDPNSPTQQMNKEDRIRVTVSAAVRDPARSRELVEGLLGEFRVAGIFRKADDGADERLRMENLETLRRAFAPHRLGTCRRWSTAAGRRRSRLGGAGAAGN